MDISVQYGVDFEFERVKNTLEKLDWYSSNGYKPKLPRVVKKGDSGVAIRRAILEEYKEEMYLSAKDKIVSEFSKIGEMFRKGADEIFGDDIPLIFIVYLTNYGVGGSYRPKNRIIINVNNSQLLKTVVHEVIHLIIEKWIQKYKISHWEKERVVDLILNSERFDFLRYSTWQKSYYGVEVYIDPLFKKLFFRNPDKFFEEIRKVRVD